MILIVFRKDMEITESLFKVVHNLGRSYQENNYTNG